MAVFKIIIAFLLIIFWAAFVFAPIIIALIQGNVLYLFLYLVWGLPSVIVSTIVIGILRVIADSI